jgi:hypothetical protein
MSKLLAIPSIGVAARTLALSGLLLCPFWGAQNAVYAQGADAIQGKGADTPIREDALKAFNERVNAYLDLKKKLEGNLPDPKPGNSAATGKVEQTQDTLAARIKAARKGAKAGDIFGDAAQYFQRIIERDTKTRGVRDAYAAMEEVPAQSPPAVNATYPEKAALATVPPLILVNLPRLPDGLEYRFMGRDLILRDRTANIVVDFIPGAVPSFKR